MAILTERDRTAVKVEVAKLAGPVKLIVFSTQLGASEYCVETERLVREVAECSDQIAVEILNLHIDRERAEAYGVDRVPAIVVEGARDYGIRFFGIPGRTYTLEYTESLVVPNWRTVTSGIVNELGYYDVIETPPAGSPARYYRTVYPVP